MGVLFLQGFLARQTHCKECDSMATKEKSQKIQIKTPNIKVVTVPIIGDTPYVPHRISEKTAGLAQHIDQQGKYIKAVVKEPRDLDAEYESCFYYDPDGNMAIPGSAFQKAMCTAAIDLNQDIHMTTVKRNIHVLTQWAVLSYDEIRRREDVVRQSGKSRAPDLRARPEFINWKTEIVIRFDADIFPLASVMNLLARAGASIGVGDHRLEQGHDSGAFHIGETNVK